MLFTPHIKRKKGFNAKKVPTPFPSLENLTPCRGVFTGISVEVANGADIITLYESGYGGSQSRRTPGGKDANNETLVLSLEEAFFLAYILKALNIYDLKEQQLNWLQLVRAAERISPLFLECLAAYMYLKSKNWVVKSGIKFGGTFLSYKAGPRFYHASFIVFVSTPASSTHFATKDLKGMQRVAETSDKDVLLLEVTRPPDFTLNSVENLSMFHVSETIVRRFNYTSFVQNQKSK